jgi:hypothetical protein
MTDNRYFEQFSGQDGRAVAEGFVIDMDDLRAKTQGRPEELQKERQKITDIVESGDNLECDGSHSGYASSPGAILQVAAHANHIDTPVWYVLPRRVPCDVLV